MYYNPGTPSSGSADPLRHAIGMRSLLGTGWGPRGDSGSARGRVRATQPATFTSLCITNQSVREDLKPGPPLLFCINRSRPCILEKRGASYSVNCSQMNDLRVTVLGKVRVSCDR